MDANDEGMRVIPLRGMKLFDHGDDIAEAALHALRRRGLILRDRDVIVVAQKIVSKVEGRRRDSADVPVGDRALALADITGKPAALIQLALDEAQEVLRAAPNVLITRHRTGHVAANSGIDASNIAGGDAGQVLLWPEDPDRSARALRDAFHARTGARVAVVIADSLGRAWRLGTIGTAIGVSGCVALDDRCGEADLYGRTLQATWVAVADSIAAAAVLVMGEGGEGCPAVLVRGTPGGAVAESRASDLLRPIEQDLFR